MRLSFCSAYDTTGQEEVYVWLSYFNYSQAANNTLESVLGYMRKSGTWAWHGGARSEGDLGNNGHWFVNRGGERILHHYRAGLNAIILFEGYRRNPDDLHLLEVAMGSNTGQLTNIDATGATSMGFHSVPFVLEHDPNSGDYGLGFFGLSLESGAYVINHPSLGWLCYLCNVGASSSTSITFSPVDAYHVRAYLEPLGLFMVAQAGTIQSVALNLQASSMTVIFDPAVPAGSGGSRPWSSLYLQLRKEGASRPGNVWTVTDAKGAPCPLVRNSYQIAPNSDDSQPTTVTITWT
jgi:hypothetical protein